MSKIYVVIVLDPDGPYVWSDDTCEEEAGATANDAFNETGYSAVVRAVDYKESNL